MYSNNYRFRIAMMVVLTLALSIFGCQKETGASSQKQNRNLPDNVELSKVKGVSIIQCPARQYFREMVLDVKAENAPLSEVIRLWCEFDGWLFIDAKLPDARYNIIVEAKDRQTAWPITKQAFEKVFGLRFVEGKETLDVWVLQKAEDSPRGLSKVEAKFSNWGTEQTSRGFGYEIRAGDMEDLAEIASKYVDEPVLDETGLTGFYKFTLAMDHWKPQTLFPAVERLGLKLQKTKRELPVMRVISSEQRTTTSPPHQSGQAR